jgi:hypothetical protein
VEVVGLKWGLFCLVSTIEELLGGEKNSGSVLENRDYGRRRFAALTIPQKLALTSPTNGGYSVSIVCSRTQATEFV